jgi:hypothetical protein
MADRVKCEMTTMADHRPFILKASLKPKLCVNLPNFGSTESALMQLDHHFIERGSNRKGIEPSEVNE